jgi:SAM-dependent methyltransferase
MPADSSHYLFKHHPETCDPDDIWGQVKRTVGGQFVAAKQISMIVGAIQSGLALGPDDSLLDLCCGNGALTTQLFAGCAGGLGVDYSRFLIDIATARFVRRPTERYVLADALEYLLAETAPDQFTKVVCYGAFPYFGNEAAAQLLTALHGRFTRVTRVFLGQLPDKARINAFYANREAKPGEQDDPGGLLGIWRTARELADLSARTGWTACCNRMPESFYASHYRFDAILTRS